MITNTRYAGLAKAYQPFPPFKTRYTNFADTVSIGHPDELSSKQQELWRASLEAFRPWKKGPFSLFGTSIDSEWQSQLKWQRLAPHLGDLRGKRIADIGAHNGYYMFRLAAHEPSLVIGFEPHPPHWYNFHLMQQFAQVPCLLFEPFGIDTLPRYPKFFDLILCLGILYHQADPIRHLRNIHQSLVAGGRVFIDCQGIPGAEPVALMPAGRYAGTKGSWWLPTLSCLLTWVQRSGFPQVRCLYGAPLSCEEQRATPWAAIKSLGDFLDKDDITKTREGYPAPWRFYLEATK